MVFDDGIDGNIDSSELVKKGIFQTIQDKESFSRVYATDHSIAWSDDLEIDVDTIYHDISGKSVEEIINGRKAHASN